MRSWKLIPLIGLLSVGIGLFKVIQVSHARSIPDRNTVEFFQGNWECKLQNSPHTVFRWTVTEGLKNSWLVGVVEAGNQAVSNDYWRSANGKIERFAFAVDGTFIQIVSPGWQSDQLVFSGSWSQTAETAQAKETITKVSDHEFHARWEKQGNDQKWQVISDEQCHK